MCGISGVILPRNTTDQAIVQIALCVQSALQGRGDQANGIAVFQPSCVSVTKTSGSLRRLRREIEGRDSSGSIAVAHCRYGTEGNGDDANIQPFVSGIENLALAHNGEIVRAADIRSQLEAEGECFQATSDTAVVLKLLERTQGNDPISRLISVLNTLPPAYALVVAWDGYLIAACDPFAVHPLCLGKLPNGGYIFASEDTAIRAAGGRVLNDVKGGQVIAISPELEISKFRLGSQDNQSCSCSFNFMYTAQPSSKLWDRSVTNVRKALGGALLKELVEREKLPQLDVVVPVLDSGRTHTLEFCRALFQHRIAELLKTGGEEALLHAEPSTLHLFDFGINRARDPLRSFMRPSQSQRDGEIGLKHFADPAVVKGRRVGVGDDTLVRGTTAKRIVKMLRDAGATEVHFLIFAPLIRHACPLGGMENKELGLLKGRTHTPEKLRDHIQADSLNILSRDAFERVINAHGHTCCTGCTGGSFPPGISEAVLK